MSGARYRSIKYGVIPILFLGLFLVVRTLPEVRVQVDSSVVSSTTPSPPSSSSEGGKTACVCDGYKHIRMAPLHPEEHYRPKWFHDRKVSVEDKSHIIPHLLGQHVDFSFYPRVVLLDLGAKEYDTSVKWFLDNYPAKFDEIYAFEFRKNVFHPPPSHAPELKGTKVVLIEKLVSTKNSATSVDIVDFMLNNITLTTEDIVVIKMDIEGHEWAVLEHMVRRYVLGLVDELLVEMHYHHPVMSQFEWDKHTHTLQQTNDYLKHLRALGLYVHPWP